MRVHSFGYNSDWAKGKESRLNIHHFGKSLLGEMGTSPHLANAKTEVVLIGHSMGGLVIKKAFVLAKQNKAYENLAKRLHSIYFLATPHRGSDSAKLLKNVLQYSYSASRAYVEDLERNSATIQSINDEFRSYSGDVNLWSFYETQKLDMGLFSRLIVEPDSAILGYREEKQMPMNADHRSICKFDTPTDPNYLIIRNALATTVNDISKEGMFAALLTTIVTNQLEAFISRSEESTNQLRDLAKYLGVPDTIEDDLVAVEEARMSGTCNWFIARQSCAEWTDPSSHGPSTLWVKGKPAAGKSVLAGYVVNKLQAMKHPCSFFFFKHGDREKSKLGTCLRSLAFQMAQAHGPVLAKLSTMQRDKVSLDDENELAIWRKLFVSCIFEAPIPTHYLVIDALDECANPDGLFNSMLAKLHKSAPLRIFITSRDNSELEKSFSSLGPALFHCESISEADTIPDIRCLVEAKAKSFNVQNEEHRVALVEKILAKSQGSFLWTALVLNELSTTYSEQEISEVLDEVPPKMEDLYLRVLDSMSRATRGRKLTKAILCWVACSTRPLTTKELDGALKLDVRDNFAKIEETITALCGQLVTVDKFGRVQMVHETVREFLLGEELDSEFAVRKSDAHTQIARVCLSYLVSDEMKPPRTDRRGSKMAPSENRADFSVYACTSFSYHLSKADPLAGDIVELVDKFLKSNILSWMNVISKTGKLYPLTRAAKNLKKYANALANERSPLSGEVQFIRGWTTDLIRISAKFAEALVTSPSSIYSVVPSLCPTESSAYKTVRPGRKISVLGLSSSQWDDRLSCIDFRQAQASALCHGDEFFAVGLTTGTIALYHVNTCQEYKILAHGEGVKLLQFNDKSDILVSGGMKVVKVWDVRT